MRPGRPPPWVDRNCTSAALAPAPRCRQRAPPTCPRRGRPRRALHWRTSAAPPARRQCRPVGCVAQKAPPVSARRAHTTGSGRSCPARRPGRAADAPRDAGEAVYCKQCFVVTHGMRYGCSRRRQRHVVALIGGGCLPWQRARVHALRRRRRVARAGGGRAQRRLTCLPMPPPTLLSVTEADFCARLTRPNRCVLVTRFAILRCRRPWMTVILARPLCCFART